MTSGSTPGGWADPGQPSPYGQADPYGRPSQYGAPPQFPPYGTPPPYSATPYPYSAPPQYSATPYPYSAPPGAPVVLFPPVPARKKSGWLRWTLGTLGVALLCCVGLVGGLVGLGAASGAYDVQATWKPGKSTIETAPSLDAPAADWIGWARRSVTVALNNQAAAMLNGDESGYLSVVDPSNKALVTEHRRTFKNLKALGLGVWTEAISGGVVEYGTRSWKLDVKVSYCFGDSTCRSSTLPMASTWQYKNDQLFMTDLDQSEPDWNGPRPWELDDLQVAQGKRVVVAASSSNAWRLADAVKAADRAASIADRFAKWDDKPNRYVIFLAGPKDWSRWYGHDQPEWAAAWAVPVGATVTEVMVRTQVVRQPTLEDLLRHELAHVTTLSGKRDGISASTWWLVEGVAEYAMMSGRAVADYDALSPTHAYVINKWNGNPVVTPPGDNASLEEASAKYGIAFLNVRRLADKYGEAKMLDFWGYVVHDDRTFEDAAPAALGASWATVKADLTKYVRATK